MRAEQPVRVESIGALDGWKLRLRFSTGEVKMFDFSPLLDAPCFRPLQDEKIFRSDGVPVWLDGFPEEMAVCHELPCCETP